jgi:hypothetical protein
LREGNYVETHFASEAHRNRVRRNRRNRGGVRSGPEGSARGRRACCLRDAVRESLLAGDGGDGPAVHGQVAVAVDLNVYDTVYVDLNVN